MELTTVILFAMMIETAQLSGLPPIAQNQLPEVLKLSPTEMGDRVCGKNWDPNKHCERYKGLFFPETNQLAYSNELTLDTDFEKSIIIHELTHALQSNKNGSVVTSCEQVIAIEKEAYTIQDYYMYKHGHYDTHLRNRVVFMKCPPLIKTEDQKK